MPNSGSLQQLLFEKPFVFFSLIIRKIVLECWISASIHKMSSSPIMVALLAYSLLNRETLSSVFDIIISLITVIVFTVLTAWDTHKLLAIADRADDAENFKKSVIRYLDFRSRGADIAALIFLETTVSISQCSASFRNSISGSRCSIMT